MGTERHLFPGGNTCYGFYSFYDHIVGPEVERKIILKGGPGVGKSSFMAAIADKFAARGADIEYHWCSSDSNSLDAIVLGNNQICMLDGTHPHIVEPRYPGAVDEIVNLGDYWDRDLLKKSREPIMQISREISKGFSRAYNKLKQAQAVYKELQSYSREYIDSPAVNRNIMVWGDNFVKGIMSAVKRPRHLFAGAITPQGIITKINSIIGQDYDLVLVKGNPGTGIKHLFTHVLSLLELNNSYAEILHNPFDPKEIDAIVITGQKLALIDITPTLINYLDFINSGQIKQTLDFDQFVKSNHDHNLIISAKSHFQTNIEEAISMLRQTKILHDELEGYYLPAMDFTRINKLRETLYEDLALLI